MKSSIGVLVSSRQLATRTITTILPPMPKIQSPQDVHHNLFFPLLFRRCTLEETPTYLLQATQVPVTRSPIFPCREKEPRSKHGEARPHLPKFSRTGAASKEAQRVIHPRGQELAAGAGAGEDQREEGGEQSEAHLDAGGLRREAERRREDAEESDHRAHRHHLPLHLPHRPVLSSSLHQPTTEPSSAPSSSGCCSSDGNCKQSNEGGERDRIWRFRPGGEERISHRFFSRDEFACIPRAGLGLC